MLNGLQIQGQAMTYIQCHFCKSMVDADLFLLQLCATQLPVELFMNTVLDMFGIRPWLGIKYEKNKKDIDRYRDIEQEVIYII